MKRGGRFLSLVAALVGVGVVLGLVGCGAAAPAYPTKDITFIVPSPQGATTDAACRALTDSVAKYMGKKFELKNVGAAGGTAAAAEVFAAKPDGYTIGMMMLLPLALQPHIMGKDLPYKGPEDLTIVQQIYSRANILAVSAKSPWKSLGDLVNDLKSGNKKEFTYAGRGVGNAEHLTMEMFARVAGIQGKVKVVPFQNDGEGTAAVLGGHVDGTAFMFASVKPNVIDGQLRPLATFMPFAGMEQFGIKSMKQLGYDLEWSPRHYIIAPKGLPKDILAKVDDAFKKGANDQAFKDYEDKVGDFLAYLPSDEAMAQLKTEYDRQGVLAKELGLVK